MVSPSALSFLTNRTSSPGNEWGPVKQKGHRSRWDSSFASDIITKRTISLITDIVILLTFDICSQSVKTYGPGNFHEILRRLHKLMQETSLPCYSVFNTWTLILNTLTEISTTEFPQFHFYFIGNFWFYWREQSAVKSTNLKICRKCDLSAIHLSLQGLKKSPVQ